MNDNEEDQTNKQSTKKVKHERWRQEEIDALQQGVLLCGWGT
jgi:hypothetical protein